MKKESNFIKAQKFLTKKLEKLNEIKDRNDHGDHKTKELMSKRYQAELDKLNAYQEQQRAVKEQSQAPMPQGNRDGGVPNYEDGKKGNLNMPDPNYWVQNYPNNMMAMDYAKTQFPDGNIPTTVAGALLEANKRGYTGKEYMFPTIEPNQIGQLPTQVNDSMPSFTANNYQPYLRQEDDFQKMQMRGTAEPAMPARKSRDTSYDYNALEDLNLEEEEEALGIEPPFMYKPRPMAMRGMAGPDTSMPLNNRATDDNALSESIAADRLWKNDKLGTMGDIDSYNALRIASGFAPILSNWYSSRQNPEWVKTAEDETAGERRSMRKQLREDAYSDPKADLRNYYRETAKGRNRTIDAVSQGSSAQGNRLGQFMAQKQYGDAMTKGSQMELLEEERQRKEKQSLRDRLYGVLSTEGRTNQQLAMAEEDRRMQAEAAARNMGRKSIEQGFNLTNTELERAEQQKLLQDLYANYEMKNGRWTYKGGNQTA